MNKLLIAVTACVSMLTAQTTFVAAKTTETTTSKTISLGSHTSKAGYPAPNKALSAKIPSKLKNPYSPIITKYAKEYGVPVDLAHAVVSIESSFNPKARGAAGEVGLMQIKPATARGMGFKGTTKALYNPDTNIRWGMEYLAKAHDLSGGQTCGTILRYNAGHGAKRMNPISKKYCGKVQAILKAK